MRTSPASPNREAPRFMAPDYRGSAELQDFVALRAGDNSGIGRDTDMKRPAQPEELSPAYVFLASPVCAGYISGIVLPVSGSVGAI